jgi:hypothetical protein
MDNTVTLKIQFDVTPSNVNAVLTQIHSTLGGLGVNVNNLNANLDNSKSSLATFDDMATKIGFRLQGIKSIFDALSGTFGAWIDDNNAGEAATAKLTQALKNQGIYSESLLADIRKYADERRDLTGIDEDATVSIAAQLTAMNLQGTQLKEAINLTQDLATLMGGDMQEAVRLIADAFSGNTTMLQRYVKGLDQADISARGMVSILEQMQRAFGGQAEARGNTNAGMIDKYRAELDDLKKSFGAILMESLAPLIGGLREIVKWLNELPTPLKAVALGITTLGIAYGFLNTQFGATPYLITGAMTILLAFYQLMKEGNVIWVAGAGAITALTAALILFKSNSIVDLAFALIGAFTGCVSTVNTLNFSFLGLNATLTMTQILTGGIFLALGVLAAVLFSSYQNTKKQNEELGKMGETAEQSKLGLANLDEQLRTMSTEELHKKLEEAQTDLTNFEVKILELQGRRNIQNIDGFNWLRNLLGLNDDENAQIAELNGRIKGAQSVIDKTQQEEEDRDKSHEAIITQLEIDERKQRANLIQDETKKQITLEDANYQEQIIKIKARQRTEHLNDQQVKVLNELAERQHQQNLKLIREQAAFEKEKFNTEQQVKDVERVKETMALEIDNAEKTALATAKTEDEKSKIQNDFAKRRVQLETDTAVLIMDLNEKVLESQIKATHDPEKIRELREQLRQLDSDIKAAQANANLKTEGVDLDQSDKDAQRKIELDAENAQYLAERDIEMKRRDEKRKSQDFFSQVNDNYVKNLARLNSAEAKYYLDEQSYLKETDAEKKKMLKSILDQDKQEVDSLGDKVLAQKKAAEENILAGTQEYDAKQSLGVQENRIINDSIRGIIAKAIIEQIAKVIEVIPWPFNLIAAPAAGLALEALLEKFIPKFASGGDVRGPKGTDQVLAWLTDGEKVMNVDASRRNYDLLDAMNRGLTVPRYAGGGSVGGNGFPTGSFGNDGVSMAAMKKEFAALRKAISKMKNEVNIQSNFDIQNYTKANKKMQRVQAAILFQ